MSDTIVLCYHALSTSWEADLSVKPERFERQLELLVDRGYRGVLFSDAVSYSGHEKILAVTFDDAFRSVNEIARPILERLGLTATVFAATDCITAGGPVRWSGMEHWVGTPFEQELTQLTWTELKTLAESGWEVGSHACTHPHLTQVDDATLEDELVRSKAECELRLSRPCTSIAYPYGDVDDRVVAATARAGYVAGAALPSRLKMRGPLEWPRVGVYRVDDERRFRLKASPVVRIVRSSPAWDMVGSHPRASAPAEVRETGESQRSAAGFFSSAKSFFLPLGPAIDPEGVHGYPIDMRVKARSSQLTSAITDQLYVGIAQYGLGAYERWLAGDGEEWLESARATAEYLMSRQQQDGSWVQHEAFPHTFPLSPPWRCGMAQGESASLLVRLHLTTGEDAYAEAALSALAPLSLTREEGGVRAVLGGKPWLEEYPTDPPSFVLNGAIFALWGLRDVAVGLDDPDAARMFDEGVDSLAGNLHRFDNGWWSLYSLYPHPVIGVASSFYHDLHVSQLRAMDMLASRPEFEATRRRWAAYAASPWNQRRAFASKAAFRLLVPRNQLLARRLPWTRL